MDLLVVVPQDVYAAAMRTAREVGKSMPLASHSLNAPLDDESTTLIDGIWDTVEGALTRAWREGLEAARPLIEKCNEKIKEVATKLARRADDIRATITERLNTFLVNAIDGALRNVRPTIAIGGQHFKMTKVTVLQRVDVSGSLKASLQSICEFVAKGELSLAAEYGRSD